MKRMQTLLACCLMVAMSFSVTQAPAAEKEGTEVLNFEMNSLAGKPVSLKDYQGKVVLIVNTASKCGATPQYRPLQRLYEKYQDQGLVVLGFPCNQFGAQEPGTARDIQEFCTANYGVTFPMFAKVDVNGDNAAPLYKLLTSKKTDPKFSGRIRWNFEKFLISRDGQIVNRFATAVDPDNEDVIKAIETELAK